MGLPLRKVFFSCLFVARRAFLIKRKVTNNGGAEMRVKITFVCSECKQRNYESMKNKKNDPDRLELKKYCRFCKKRTVHKESK